jgi:hypothetical protein
MKYASPPAYKAIRQPPSVPARVDDKHSRPAMLFGRAGGGKSHEEERRYKIIKSRGDFYK